jgi:hypothetical protein
MVVFGMSKSERNLHGNKSQSWLLDFFSHETRGSTINFAQKPYFSSLFPKNKTFSFLYLQSS